MQTVAKKDFSIKQALHAAWAAFKQRPWFYIGVTLVAGLVPQIITNLSESFEHNSPVALLLIILGFFASVVTTYGVTKIFLHAMRGERAQWSDFESTAKGYLKFFAVMLTLWVTIGFGFLLLIVPGFIVMIILFFAMTVAVDRPNLSIKETILESARITKGVRWKVFGLCWVAIGIVALGFLSLIVGVLVAAPVVMLLYSYVYLQLTGQKTVVDDRPITEYVSAQSSLEVTQEDIKAHSVKA